MKSKIFGYFIFLLAIISIATECSKEEEEIPPYGHKLYAYFTVEPETGPVNTIFTFNANDSYYDSPVGPVHTNHVLTQWDFDYRGEDDIDWDTDFSYESIVQHAYYEVGTYTVMLGVKYNTKDSEYKEEMTRTVVVTEVPNYEPLASFIISPQAGNVLTEFTFDASGCTDDQTPVTNLEVIWDFDNNGGWDTQYSTNKIATHQYDQEGAYEVRMNVKDAHGSVSELILSLTIENCNQGGEPCDGIAFVNHQGEQYNTVQIGSQCWLDRNLNNGEMIESVNNQSNQTDNGVVEKFCYDNELTNCEIYGGLYQWNEMMSYNTQSNQGICPDGWHIPTTTDWHVLIDFLGGEDEASGKLKSCTDDWKYSVVINSNESGFTGLPAGKRLSNSPFDKISEVSMFWSSKKDALGADAVSLHYVSDVSFGRLANFKNGFSVRCIKD